MKHLALILTLTLIACAAAAQTTVDARLEWNEYYKLSWDDFQGIPSTESHGDAATSVQIKAKPFYIKDEIHYDVYAYFNRQKSWKREQTPDLLQHEQLHFDIAELYARKIRQEIMRLKSLNVNDVDRMNSAVRLLLEESNRVDIQYDAETLHGSFPKKQKYWSDKVKSDLEALDAFKKPRRVIGARKSRKSDSTFSSR
jgi:hypothetical protein